MNATQTNAEESERDKEWGSSEQEDSDQPRQNKDIVAKRGTTSRVAWRDLAVKGLTQTSKLYLENDGADRPPQQAEHH